MSFVMSDAHARALGMEDVMRRRLPYPADAGDAGGGGRRDANPRVGSAPGVRPAQCQEPDLAGQGQGLVAKPTRQTACAGPAASSAAKS